MSFSPEQNNQQNKKESSDIFVPKQGVEEFYVEKDPRMEINKCSNLGELSNVLAELKTVVDDENFVTEEEMKKVSDLCREAHFALVEETVENFLARQDEVPEAFGLREKYVKFVTEKFKMHRTLH